MSQFLDLSEELLVLVLQNLFEDGWIHDTRKRMANLQLRLVCKTFDRLICPMAFGTLEIDSRLVNQAQWPQRHSNRTNRLPQEWLKRLVISKSDLHERYQQPTLPMLSAIQMASVVPAQKLSSITGLSLPECLHICRDALCLIVCVYHKPVDILERLRPNPEEPIQTVWTKTEQANWILGDMADNWPSVDAGFNHPLWLVTAKGDVELVKRILAHATASASSIALGLAANVAVRLGHHPIFSLLLKFGVDVHERDSKLDTLLHHAVRQGNKQVVHALLEHGADMSARNRRNITPLGCVDSQGDITIPRELLLRGASPNVWSADLYPWAPQSEDSPTLLAAASSQGNTDLVKLLLHHGVQVDPDPLPTGNNLQPDTSRRDESALAMAVYYGHGETARVLLEAGASLLGVHRLGETIAISAARSGDIGLIQLLLDHGMQINQEDPEGLTALDVVLMENPPTAPKTVSFLIANGARVNPHSTHFLADLDMAAEHGAFETILLLLKNVVVDDVSLLDLGGTLLTAATYGNIVMVRALLDQGVPVGFMNLRGNAMQLALENGHPDVVRLLLERGADANERDTNESTPLHAAIFQGSLANVRLLIQHGADVEKGDYRRGTPLMAARINRREDILRALLDEGHAGLDPGNEQEWRLLEAASTIDDKIDILLWRQP
ncbi:MAG: hypothetical protein M1823_006177 [Watsoniomyces obsoletus]|nr:MAG: hypothetical protein M1823_006177 [Watsoniomyces obsoletus]